jgi:hypothetical protein
MDRQSIIDMPMEKRLEYFNERLATGEDYEAILESVGFTKKEAGQSEPYGLGLIKIGKEVKPKPGRGDNGFAW